jgi:hypothetical protein
MQTIKSFTHQDDTKEVDITYYGMIAVDLPNGLKKGDELNFAGKSIFRFLNGKIISLTDIS